ncbi:glutathione S-transferase P 2-like [Lineus longissimus]|uniref:glutathione S-transferase P 2-like n=1 Tax=Lineus longissimus TaxID=88925 RepID=UPI002B4CC8F6
MSEGYELYYWPFAGRGEFIRLIFEDAGVPFKDISDRPTLLELKEGRDGFYPGFAPPYLRKGNFTLNQTPVICRYLGKEYGYWPEKEEDHWHAEQVNATIHDFIAEGRLVFHGVGFVKSYYDQVEETKPYIAWFKKERFAKWLGLFERNLAANHGGTGFVVGDKCTYVDLALLHVLRAAASQFPDEWAAIDTVPLLKAFKLRMEERPRLAAYFKSDRCRPFEGSSMM